MIRQALGGAALVLGIRGLARARRPTSPSAKAARPCSTRFSRRGSPSYKSVAPDVDDQGSRHRLRRGHQGGDRTAMSASAPPTPIFPTRSRNRTRRSSISRSPSPRRAINYNLPGLNGANIKIDGPTLAAIYSGKVTGVGRSRDQGDKSRRRAATPDRSSRFGVPTAPATPSSSPSSSISRPRVGKTIPASAAKSRGPKVAAEKTANGNDGVVQTLAATPYAIGYVESAMPTRSPRPARHRHGQEPGRRAVLLPSPQSVAARPRARPSHAALERISLVFAPGDDSYP